MTVRAVKGGYATVHCHGKKKGKVISKFRTKKEALAQHRAIQASKAKRRHHSAADGDWLAKRMALFLGD